MSAGVGMDLIEVARVERALDRHPRLAERLFTQGELGYARSMARPGRHLAARFAAKEAVVKALALPPGSSLREIEIVPGDDLDPAPQVRLNGAVLSQARARGLKVRISLTHSREIAGAVAVADRMAAEQGEEEI